MASPRRPALGNDPFAALGLTPVAPAPAASARPQPGGAKPRKAAKPAVAKSRSASSKTAKAAKVPVEPRRPEPSRAARQATTKPVDPSQSPRVSPKLRRAESPRSAKTATAPALDLRAIENRLEAAFRSLDELRLPEGPGQRDLRDELFEQVRGLLRMLSPATYWRLYHETLLAGRSLDIDPFGLDPVFEERAERLADFLYRRWWRVEAPGVENVPAGGRALLVSNHSGMLPYDGAMIKHAVRVEHPARRTVRFLVENFVFYFPFLGTMVYRYGGVRASMDNALRLLGDDQLTAVFPEGVKGLGKPYRARYQLQRFGRGGFVKLAMRARSPIIPVAVVGAEEIHPIIGRLDILAKTLRVPYVPVTPTLPWLGPLGLVPLPSRWSISFGEPMLFPLEYGPEEADNEILVNELTLRVRRTIHAMIYARLARRRSVFFG